MSNQTNDWMERLAKNYKLPEDKPKETKEKVSLLKESQLRIIMDRDKKDLVNKKK
jgi:Mg2+/Co2+ transporter CorC